MKRIFTIIAATLVAATMFTANAQRPEGRGEKGERPTPEQMAQFRAQKMAEALELDEATTEKFLPVYTLYLTESRELNKHARHEKSENLTDEQIEAQIKEGFEKSQKLLDLRVAYFEQFKQILDIRQIRRMYGIEKQMGEHAQGGFRKGQGGHRGEGEHQGEGHHQGGHGRGRR